MRCIAKAVVFLLVAMTAAAQQHDPAIHAQHEQEMNARGEKAMGFSQTATTHHFILLRDGGYVQVTANDSADTKSVNAIRAHLARIQKSFAAGDFSAPELTHAQAPPGTEIMRNAKDDIHYTVEEMKGGGRLRMASENSQAVEAIHAFLRFQIEEHKTGDPNSISPDERAKPTARTTPEEQWLYPAQRVSADIESIVWRLHVDMHAIALANLASEWWKQDRDAAAHWLYPAIDDVATAPQEETDAQHNARASAIARVFALVHPLDPIASARLDDILKSEAAKAVRGERADPRRWVLANSYLGGGSGEETAQNIAQSLQYGVTPLTLVELHSIHERSAADADHLFAQALAQSLDSGQDLPAFLTVLTAPASDSVPQQWRDAVASAYIQALQNGSMNSDDACQIASTIISEPAQLSADLQQSISSVASNCGRAIADLAADAEAVQRRDPHTADDYLATSEEVKSVVTRYHLKLTAAEKAEKEDLDSDDGGPVRALHILDTMGLDERTVRPGEYQRRRAEEAVSAAAYAASKSGCSRGMRIVETSPRDSIFHIAVGMAEKVDAACARSVTQTALRQMNYTRPNNPNDYVRLINLVLRLGMSPESNLQSILREMDTWRARDPRTAEAGEPQYEAQWNQLLPLPIVNQLFDIPSATLATIARGSFHNELLKVDFELLLVRGFVGRYASDLHQLKQQQIAAQ